MARDRHPGVDLTPVHLGHTVALANGHEVQVEVCRGIRGGDGDAARVVSCSGRSDRRRTNKRASRQGRLDLLARVAALTFVALPLAVLPQSGLGLHSYSDATPATDAVAATPGMAPASEPTRRHARDAYAKLPLSFIPNGGQTDESVRYYAQGAGYAFYFTD